MADEKKAKTPRYDVMITGGPGYKAPNDAIRSVIMMLAFRGFAKPTDEAIAEDWLEVYMEPGVSASEVFFKTAYNGPQPVFYEAIVRAGQEPMTAEYGPTGTPLYFMIEFRGCIFKEPLGPFRKILLDSLHLRANVHVREHAGLPSHKVVPEDEAPIDKKKHKREIGPGLVGSKVDEW